MDVKHFALLDWVEQDMIISRPAQNTFKKFVLSPLWYIYGNKETRLLQNKVLKQ